MDYSLYLSRFCSQSSKAGKLMDGVFRNRESFKWAILLSDSIVKGIIFSVLSFGGIVLIFLSEHPCFWMMQSYASMFVSQILPPFLSHYCKPLALMMVTASVLFPLYGILRWICSGTVLSSKLCVRNMHAYSLSRNSRKIVSMDGKVVVLTGGHCGIGYFTALQLCRWGAVICIGCRNVTEGNNAAQRIQEQIELELSHSKKSDSGSGNINCFYLDLNDLNSVRKFADMVTSKFGRIDILVNNAGVMQIQKHAESNGYEKQFSTNHLGHFLLTNLLLNQIKKTNGRIINVSSLAHIFSPDSFYPPHAALTEAARKAAYACAEEMNIHCENPKNELKESNYFPNVSYGISKMANIWFTHELQRRLSADKFTHATAYSLHPGCVSTKLDRHINTSILTAVFAQFLRFFFLKNAEDGAATTLYLCGTPKEELEPGGYYQNCAITGVSKDANNEEKEILLWKMSERAVGLY